METYIIYCIKDGRTQPITMTPNINVAVKECIEDYNCWEVPVFAVKADISDTWNFDDEVDSEDTIFYVNCKVEL